MGGEGKKPSDSERFFALAAASGRNLNAPMRETDFVRPLWCHRHGDKLIVTKVDVRNRCLILATNAVSIRFTPRACSVDEGWFVDWEIRYSQQEQFRGRIILSTRDLLSAFDLQPAEEDDTDKALARRYDATVAKQGRYIRTGPYLNIPGPGTGNDGDPNLSIHLCEAIMIAMDKVVPRDPA